MSTSTTKADPRQTRHVTRYTRKGTPVHARTVDHLPSGSAYQRFNKRFALWLANNVGTMTCFYVFCVLALCSLPAILNEFSAFHGIFPSWLVATSLIALIAWISSNFLQLVLLPSLMVGQNLQNEAADARATKTFEDVEDARQGIAKALDLLDCHTEGGLKTLLDAIDGLKDRGGRVPDPPS
jgi:hypothetical protein